MFSSQIAPCIHQDFKRHPQNGFRPWLALYGSIWFFEGGVLHGFSARIFYAFGPRGQIWDPGAKKVPGLGLGPFWSKNSGPDKVVLWTNDFPNGDYRGHPEGNGLYGTQEAFGQVISPQPHLGNWFHKDFLFLGKLTPTCDYKLEVINKNKKKEKNFSAMKPYKLF